MRGAHVNALFGFCVNPSVKNAPAGKHQRVYPIIIDDGQFNIAVKRCGGYRLPGFIAFQFGGTLLAAFRRAHTGPQ